MVNGYCVRATCWRQGLERSQIWLDGDATLLITDKQGRRLGFVDGEFVNEIPGARAVRFKTRVEMAKKDESPVY